MFYYVVDFVTIDRDRDREASDHSTRKWLIITALLWHLQFSMRVNWGETAYCLAQLIIIAECNDVNKPVSRFKWLSSCSTGYIGVVSCEVRAGNNFRGVPE